MNQRSAIKESNRATVPTSSLEIDKSTAVDNGNEEWLDGLTFVLTGVFDVISRDKLEEFIVKHGGRCTTGVSGKTNYLIAGYKLEDGREVSQGSKYRKAETLGTPILDEEKFESLVKNLSKNEGFSLGTKIPTLPSIPEEVEMKADDAN
jgi:BRCT domain type II-containing protein